MCGVIGYAAGTGDPGAHAADLARLLHQSKVRGLHAFGFAYGIGAGRFRVERGTSLDLTMAMLFGTLQGAQPPRALIAHCRYSTSGDWRNPENNQPIVAGGRALAFNGCLHMGTKQEFETAFGVQCDSDNDGEVFLRRMEGGQAPEAFLAEIRGSFAGCWLESDGSLRAVRNRRRPLHRAERNGGTFIGSTADIFRRAGFNAGDVRELHTGTVLAFEAAVRA